MKRWYSECVRHLLAEYIQTCDIGTSPKFNNEAERINWLACHEVMTTLSQKDFEIVVEMYRRGDTLADKIFSLATARRTSQRYFWNLADDVEYRIAKKRDLI